MRVFLYARVSTREKGQDVETQLRQLREFCQRQGWEPVHEYVDRESGAKSDRLQFQAMLLACSQRKADVVVFWSLDRFTREGTYETLRYLNLLCSYNVMFRSYTEQWVDSCGIFKDAIIGFLAAIAKQERARLAERVRAGLERVKASGKRLGRPREQLNMSRMRAMRAQGLGWRTIARGVGVSYSTVRRALKMSEGPLQKGVGF
jgi:DNA invertase Pin-like site-specific DNA recombinase